MKSKLQKGFSVSQKILILGLFGYNKAGIWT